MKPVFLFFSSFSLSFRVGLSVLYVPPFFSVLEGSRLERANTVVVVVTMTLYDSPLLPEWVVGFRSDDPSERSAKKAMTSYLVPLFSSKPILIFLWDIYSIFVTVLL